MALWEKEHSRHREGQTQIPGCFRENKHSGPIKIHLMNNVTLDYLKKSIASLVSENKNKPPDFLHEMFLKPLWLNDAINMGLFWVVR